MKKTTNVATLQGNKATNNKPTKVSANTIKQASAKVEQPKKESTYKISVLDSNKILKEESAKLGYCVKVLINNINILKLSPLMAKNLQAINKDSEAYKLAVNNCRKSKNGNYSPFYLLQYLYSISK
jgi:hypothetical protein